MNTLQLLATSGITALFGVIGLNVGLRFGRASMTMAGRIADVDRDNAVCDAADMAITSPDHAYEVRR